MAVRPRVLIADDEVLLAEMLKRGLAGHGFSCVTATTGTPPSNSRHGANSISSSST